MTQHAHNKSKQTVDDFDIQLVSVTRFDKVEGKQVKKVMTRAKSAESTHKQLESTMWNSLLDKM